MKSQNYYTLQKLYYSFVKGIQALMCKNATSNATRIRIHKKLAGIMTFAIMCYCPIGVFSYGQSTEITPDPKTSTQDEQQIVSANDQIDLDNEPGLVHIFDDVDSHNDDNNSVFYDKDDNDQIVFENPEDFTELDLEDLMDVVVTSVAGIEQSLLNTPAAMYVITSEDIRRSGHRSVYEALRMVPGMNVARVDAGQWGISARGFTSLFADKMLVLIDGRTVYDPMFSGVFWNLQDMLLEDVDHIEVIRGPGATLWGANAVNGVINITTKNAADTQGFYWTALGGNEELLTTALRYGGKINDKASYRLWGKYRLHDNFVDTSGNERSDDWDFLNSGVRFDWQGETDTNFTLSSEIYNTGHIGQTVRSATPGHMTFRVDKDDAWANGGHLLFNVKNLQANGHGWSLQTYYDRFNSRRYGVKLNRDTFDVDFRHHFPTDNQLHELIWGVGARYTRAQIDPSATLDFRDHDRETYILSGFLQDTIQIVPNKLAFMLGSKFSHNSFTGIEIQPNARLSWTPNDRNTVWASISRAVKTPARIEDDMLFTIAYVDTGLMNGGPPSGIYVPVNINGNSAIESEVLIAYELGYRTKLTNKLQLDMTAFFNDYDEVTTVPETGGTQNNNTTIETYGFEISSTLDVYANWRLIGNYSLLETFAHTPYNDLTYEQFDPHHQFNLQSRLDITEKLEFNAGAYYVDKISYFDIPAYIRLDLGFTYRPRANVELSIWGQNLLEPSHVEFADQYMQDRQVEIERSIYGQISIKF